MKFSDLQQVTALSELLRSIKYMRGIKSADIHRIEIGFRRGEGSTPVTDLDFINAFREFLAEQQAATIKRLEGLGVSKAS